MNRMVFVPVSVISYAKAKRFTKLKSKIQRSDSEISRQTDVSARLLEQYRKIILNILTWVEFLILH